MAKQLSLAYLVKFVRRGEKNISFSECQAFSGAADTSSKDNSLESVEKEKLNVFM